MNLRILVPALILTATSLVAGDTKAYGKPLTLKQETKISEIMASPESFKGRKVRVRGTVTGVCEERGCYLNLKSDKKFQEIMFKVDDGVIVFPADSLGREAVAEGIVSILTLSEQEQRDMCPIEAKALNRKFDPKKIKGPMQIVRIDGLGAEIRK